MKVFTVTALNFGPTDELRAEIDSAAVRASSAPRCWPTMRASIRATRHLATRHLRRHLSTEVFAWAAHKAGAPLEPYKFELPSAIPPPGYVDVAIKYCGICGSDVHQLEDAWGVATWR